MENKTSQISRGIFLMLLAALSFGVMATFVKFACRTIPSNEVVFFRSLLGSIAIAYVIWKEKASWIGHKPVILFWRGFTGFVALSMHFYAIAYLNLGTAVMLNYTAPIFVVIMAKTFLKEKISRVVRIAVFASFIGMYFLTAPQLESKPLPLLIGLLSGICAAGAYTLIRYSHENESPYTIVFYFTVISAIGSVPLLKFGFKWPNPFEWLILLGVTAGAFFGQVYMTKSIKSSPISVVMPFAYLTPVFATLMGMIFWKEYLGPIALLGSIIIIASGITIYIFRDKTPYIPIEE
ncbi:MAG: hypothetical protein A3G33_02225 [Omnitrophica bacterium RIFCSPLOWO2_12_FULL_44_17]|uniref:EamA domain-containing protein n=1 Tax=Candidatus Danuiimicrobium aquiferis TaxID=1801832 RepID=A0A1G1L246_9BACT|nr:MAG: hypothetical protein A3B72_08745 [Omnitrophica bacterium RIFCSPHIGHO2_02_FULL_45_28]OGW90697.1 MAG: hypothetical protein A3E74_05655 [Omnitrophica bacterium RIFCSPHIGHO2_12_FULL_44_12]OGW99232.1 MAG: hypothetical protein A3G33_02225 [Omnitrophica bacterium RIFCSPLOWO2_12_FULL_44_17]OGX04702.1 MAG: hypothetical protein A3J12_00065 [Omnitrophica bacterium RIFCSPLOWO2_02_FULL_44_11]